MAVEDLASIQTLVMEVEQEVIVLVLVLMVSIMVSTMVLILMVDKVEQVLDNLIKTLVDKAIIEGAHNTMQQVRIQQQRKLKNLPNNCPMYLHISTTNAQRTCNLGWHTIVRYEG